MFFATIIVHLRYGVKDIQGEAVSKQLGNLGYHEIDAVRIGKCIEVDINVNKRKDAKELVEKTCDTLLVNAVIERYEYTLKKSKGFTL